MLRPENSFALAARAVQAVTMLLAAACVTWRFSLPEQGLFFVFLSLGALVQLGDFGLGYATLQMSSHFAAGQDRQRLQEFSRRARHLGWKLLTAVAVVVAVAGALAMHFRADPPGVAVSWAGPWALFVVAVAAAHAVSLALQLVEGVRSAALAWRVRFVQEVLAGLCFLAALLAHAGLWSLVVYAGVRALVGAAWLLHDAEPASAAANVSGSIDWRREVWPFQWRVGLSALSGFLIFQAFNPLLLIEQGSEAAGRFGLSLAIMNMLLMVTTAWPLSQAARYGQLLATRQGVALQKAFGRTLWGSTALAVALALSVLLAYAVLQAAGIPQLQRLADLPTTAALLAAGVLHHVVMVLAVLLRAERREPLLWVSIVGSLVTLGAVWLAARQGGLLGPALANAGMAVVGLLWVSVHYRAFASRVFQAPAPLEPAR